MGCNSSKPSPGAAPGSNPAPASGSTEAENKGTAKTALSKTPDPTVLSQYCVPGPAPVSLTAMRDSAGYIGAYVFKRLILDSPISYLDPQGKEVAMFHIFGSPEEKKKNAPIIDTLRAAYPVETPVDCAQGKAP